MKYIHCELSNLVGQIEHTMLQIYISYTYMEKCWQPLSIGSHIIFCYNFYAKYNFLLSTT